MESRVMRFEFDPDLALHTRLSFGRHAVLVAVVLLAGLSLAATIASAPGSEFLMLPAGASLAALVVSLPFGAIHILTLDRDGRLDQQRLSGRSDVRLAAVLFAGASGVLFLFGTPALMLSRHLGMAPVQVAALVVGAAAAANLLLVVRWISDANTPVLAGMAVLFTLWSSLAVATLPSAATWFFLIGSTVWISTLPFVLARIRRPGVAARRRSTAILGPLFRMQTARLAEFTRVMLSKSRFYGMLAGGLVVPLLMLLPLERRDMRSGREGISGALLYVVVIVAALDASGRTRRERLSDGMDRICLSGQRRWSVVFQFVASYGLPYSIVAATAVAPRIWLNPRSAWIFAPWPLIVMVMSSIGLAEGLRGRRLATYVLPATFAWVVAINPGHGRAWPMIYCAVWIPLVMAAQCLERPDGPPIPARLVPLAAATLGASVTSLVFQDSASYLRGYGMFLAGWMSLAAGLLLPDRAPRVAPRMLAAAAVACAVGAGVAQYYAFYPDMVRYVFATSSPPRLDWPSTHSMLQGTLAACGLIFGWLAHTRFAAVLATSLLARLFPLLLALALMATGRWSVRSVTIDLSFAAVLAGVAAAMWLIPLGGRYARTQS